MSNSSNAIRRMSSLWFLVLVLFLSDCKNDGTTTIVGVSALKVVIAGGTGRLGSTVASKLKDHTVLLLSRNSFSASSISATPKKNRPFIGDGYFNDNPHVDIHDWDGGNNGNIISSGEWQEEALKGADVVVNLVGDYTNQRLKAAERIVHETLRYSKQAVQITVSPKSGESVRTLASGAYANVEKRIDQCEEMVQNNCLYSVCLRLDAGKKYFSDNVEEIVYAIESSE